MIIDEIKLKGNFLADLLKISVLNNEFLCMYGMVLCIFWYICIWVRSRRCGCLLTWFCCQMIAKPGNKTVTPSWPDPYLCIQSWLHFPCVPPHRCCWHVGCPGLGCPQLPSPWQHVHLRVSDASSCEGSGHDCRSDDRGRGIHAHQWLHPASPWTPRTPWSSWTPWTWRTPWA